MAAASFKTNPVLLSELLHEAETGDLQLPDFQRSWVWDEDRIKSLIASVSRAFPVGAIMTLETGGAVDFKPRLVEGASGIFPDAIPGALLLDGQQRITSLYQVTMRGKVVSTVTARKKRVKRWYYIDIVKAMDPAIDREEAIFGVPEDRVLRSEFGRTVDLDLSTRELEIEHMMYPVSKVFDFFGWYQSYIRYFIQRADSSERIRVLDQFKQMVLDNFEQYHVPVIALDKATSKEAVCVVFEKVNTGGKVLDAFELITATYAADNHELRKDWYGQEGAPGRHDRFRSFLKLPNAKEGVLAGVGNTDFLHVISLFHTRDRRREASRAGKSGRDLPQIIGNRAALLNLPLSAYLKYEPMAERGFERAAKFLHMLHIYRVYDLPYQSQLIPLAAILGENDDILDHALNRSKLVQWYWNGVFGELYGWSVETRIARDFVEVPAWIDGGSNPTTVDDSTFRSERLKTMRMRLSAAYKGVNALLMEAGARDFRSNQKYEQIVFFEEGVDIHHIFPKDWCKLQNISRSVYDSIINKTPLSARTNRIIGGVAPSAYVEKLEKGGTMAPAVQPGNLDDALRSHLIDPSLLRSDDFTDFMADRQKKLINLIEIATGKPAFRDVVAEEGEDLEFDDEFDEAEHTMALQ